MSELPIEVSTGTVHGRFIVAFADGDDVGQDPDATIVQGKIVFSPGIPYSPLPVTSEGPVTMFVAPVTGVLDSEGYLCTPHPLTGWPMYRGVKLVATDDADLSVTGWTWTATYQLEPTVSANLAIPAHSFALPSGASVDLSSLVKVPASPGYGLPQAEAAAFRAESAALSAGADATEAVAAALRAEQVAGATDAGVASLLTDPLTDTGGALAEALAPKANSADVTTSLGLKADKTELTNGLAVKADQTYVDSELTEKADQSALDTGLATKADLEGGLIPVSQIPADALVTDANIAAQVNGSQTGPAIDARINTQVTPTVEQITADYIASQPAVVDAAAAAVDANPTIATLLEKNTSQDTAITAAKTDAIADATTKYGGLPARVLGLESATKVIDAPTGFNANSVSTQAVHMVHINDGAINMPGAGTWLVRTWPQGGTALLQEAVLYNGSAPEIHTRRAFEGTWSGWVRMDADKWATRLGTIETTAIQDRQAALADATAKANTAKAEAISAASSDATTKANAARDAAAADATAKAATAESNAKAYTDQVVNTSHLASDTDGTPYYSPGSMTLRVFTDTDGVPFFFEA